jgi:hypothetical protein
MARIRNLTAGPRGVHTAEGGLAFLAPDETAVLDVAAGELASARATGWFAIEDQEAAPLTTPRKER